MGLARAIQAESEFRSPSNEFQPTPEGNDLLLRQYSGRIRMVALSVRSRYGPQVELDELVSAGQIGVLDALRRFDSSKRIQFKTYAEFRIRGMMLDRIRTLDPVPKWLRQKGREMEQARSRIEQRLGRPATNEETAREMGVPVRDLHALLCRLRQRNVSTCVDDGPVESFHLEQEPSPALSPFQLCLQGEVRVLLQDALAKLPERERQVLSLRYEHEMTTVEIGRILQVHQSRISQLHHRAVKSLRSQLPDRPHLLGHLPAFSC